MPSQFKKTELEKRDLADYGFARARDLAFDAVYSLWLRREAEGMKKKDIANVLDRDPGWVSRSLRGPGNWTMRTLGELTAALDGELEIVVRGIEDPISPAPNFHAYADYPKAVIADRPSQTTAEVSATAEPAPAKSAATALTSEKRSGGDSPLFLHSIARPEKSAETRTSRLVE